MQYLILDGAYVIFTALFSAKYAYQREYPDSTYTNDMCFEDELFWPILVARLQYMISKFSHQLHVPAEHIFFVREGKRELLWRNEHITDYKAGRKNVSAIGLLFRRVYRELLPQWSAAHSFHLLRVIRAEADDVIFLLTRFLRSYEPRATITIITRDSDFVQLIDSHTHLLTHNLTPLFTAEERATAESLLMTKILLGDRSDNIPGCIKGPLPENLNLPDLIIEDKIDMVQYQLNRRLIMYQYIPLSLKMEIHHEIITNLVFHQSDPPEPPSEWLTV